ncbi:MAG: hypothetical protein Q8L74_09845 [Nitrospirota bacterium]|nr:hypothetical protein [Nitrospirota bacterium]MDP2382993.1 hypothetical protein [Nitrospirota bacterium]
MPRAKTSDQSRARSKTATVEELTRGVGKLQEFLSQVEDLGREGFPYMDAARARTELQFRECVRRTFGEKSTEFQEHRQHKLLMDSPEETQRSIALIKTLIAKIEQKKHELQGGGPPQMTLVPASIPTVQMAMLHTAPVASPPLIMSVAMTTPLDPSSATAAPDVPPPLTDPLAQTQTATSSAPPHPVILPAPAALHPSTSTPQTAPPRHATETVVPPMLSARPAQEAQQPSPSMPATPARTQATMPQSLLAESDPLDLVKGLCSRFHAVARQLRLRGEHRATLSVEDEFDAQDLLHAILRTHFDDIGTDEWAPSYAAGSPRTTFLLNNGRLAVLVKKTRPGLSAKDLTAQLKIDADRYRSHERCATLLCFMYDPEGRIGNPRGLEADLTSVSDSFIIDVLVAPK